MAQRVDYDKSPNASLEQKFLSLADSINRAMESLEEEISKQALSLDLSGIDIGSIGGGDGEVAAHTHLVKDVKDLTSLNDNQVEEICDFKLETAGGILPIATPFVPGCVVPGDGIKVDDKGVISTDTVPFEGVMAKKLLWTNPDPTVNFATQTISLDLSEYSEVEIVYRPFVSIPDTKRVACKIDSRAVMDLVMSNAGFTEGATVFAGFRRISVTASSVIFGVGYDYVDPDDRCCIPVEIYGIKDVSGHLAKISGVVDSLDNDSPVHALSAAKGKELNDRLDTVADYVVESGNIGIFYYQKWNSGKMEVWGRSTWTLTNYTTVNGFYAYCSTINLPVTFADRPIVHYALQIGSGFSMPAAGFMGVTTTSFNWYGLATAGGTQDCTVTFLVTGKWK